MNKNTAKTQKGLSNHELVTLAVYLLPDTTDSKAIVDRPSQPTQ